MTTELLEIWYDCLVGHHKDRDCWFSIRKQFCVYKPQKWIAQHDGYLYNYEEEFETYDEAYLALTKFVCTCIEELAENELRINKEDPQESNAPSERWELILKKLEDYKKLNHTNEYDFALPLERERDEAVSELKAERDAHEFTFTSYTIQREENVRMVSQLDNSQAETAEAIAYYKKLEAERLELERIRDADAATITRLSQEVGDLLEHDSDAPWNQKDS